MLCFLWVELQRPMTEMVDKRRGEEQRITVQSTTGFEMANNYPPAGLTRRPWSSVSPGMIDLQIKVLVSHPDLFYIMPIMKITHEVC